MSSDLRREDGFNLLEVMIVVLILAILVSIAILSYTSSSSRARRITCKANQQALSTGASVYRTQFDSDPIDIEDLRPYVQNFDAVITCPERDGTLLEYDLGSGLVTCANHP